MDVNMKRALEISELLLVFMIIIACHATKNMNVPVLPAFDKEGHRGCRALMPENTIPAMLKALDLGVTTLEMDVLITADGQVIVSHDPYFNHDITTRPDGKYVEEDEERSLAIYKMSYDATQHYDVGLKPHPRFPQQQKLAVTKPLLSALIDSVENYCAVHGLPRPFYNIETKTQPATDNIYHPAPAPFVSRLMSVVKSKRIAGRTIIQSFDFRTLQIIHKDYPNIRTAALIEESDKRSLPEHIRSLGFTPAIYSPAYQLVTQELVDQCHRQKIKLIPWTVNDKPTMEKLKAMGVDGIITDDPQLF